MKKVKLDFKVKYIFINALSFMEFYYVFTCESAKEVCDTLEMTYGVSQSITQKGMKIYIKKVETSNECKGYLHR